VRRYGARSQGSVGHDYVDCIKHSALWRFSQPVGHQDGGRPQANTATEKAWITLSSQRILRMAAVARRQGGRGAHRL